MKHVDMYNIYIYTSVYIIYIYILYPLYVMFHRFSYGIINQFY